MRDISKSENRWLNSLWIVSMISKQDDFKFTPTFIVNSDVFCCEWRPVWIEMKLNFFACSVGGMLFRLFRGWDSCSLLAPHTKYGIPTSCILCWLMLVSAAVICTHAEAFLLQTQNSLTFFDQLPIRVHYPTGLSLAIARSSVWLQARLRPVQCSL